MLKIKLNTLKLNSQWKNFNVNLKMWSSFIMFLQFYYRIHEQGSLDSVQISLSP